MRIFGLSFLIVLGASNLCAQQPPAAPVPVHPTLPVPANLLSGAPSAPASDATVPAGADPFSDPLIKSIQERHEKGVNGDVEAVKSLVTDLERLTKEQPKNNLLLVYLGSAYTLRSRDVFPGPSKYSYLKNGVATMKRAVDADPTNVPVRFVRAVNFFHLPAFCGTRDVARADFQTLLQEINGPQAPVLNTSTRQAIYYFAGLSYEQLRHPDDARVVWQKGLTFDPSSQLALKMQTHLSKL